MAEEIAFEIGTISNYQGLVTLTLDRVILHTVVHHPSTSTYTPNFTEIEKSFVDGWTYIRTYKRTIETHFIRSTQKSRPKNWVIWLSSGGVTLHHKFDNNGHNR